MDKNDQLFAGLVMQYQQLAMMALGKLARPEGGTRCDLGEASLFIDILAMLEAKTRGNLDEDIKRLLATALSDLRLNYVDEARREEARSATPPGDDGREAGTEAR
jgi:hypothetical protein